jgi:hypothetical protein
VLVTHNRKCKLAYWSYPNNITSFLHVLGHATEEQTKQPNIHMQGVEHLLIDVLRRKRYLLNVASEASYYSVCLS